MTSDDSTAEAGERARFGRVRLINEELDRLTVDAADRTASVTNKASFLAVAAGVLIAASTAQRWDIAAAYGVISLGLSCGALTCAAIALRPGKRPGIDARRLADQYIDSTQSVSAIERQIARDKAAVLHEREADLRLRTTWIWAGFATLAFAAVALTLAFALETLGS